MNDISSIRGGMGIGFGSARRLADGGARLP
jgi:hypothetical protein